MAIQKGTSKEIENSPGSRERERDGESLCGTWKSSAKNSPILPFRSACSISASFSGQRFLANSRLTFFCLPILYFALRFAFGFWFHTIYFCYFLLILNIFRTAYAFIISPVPTDHFRLRLSFRFSRFSISFLSLLFSSLLFSLSLVQLSQCHKHRNLFFFAPPTL